MNLDRVQAEEKVLPKATGAYFLVQIGVRRGDDSNIHTARLRRPNALHLAAFQDAQQLGLLGERDVGDLVQKKCSPVSQFESSDPIRPRVGESAFHMAKQFAFKNPLRQPSGVHRNQWPRSPAGERMQSPSHDLLPAAMFSRDQNVGVGGADAADQAQHRLHGLGVGDEFRQSFRAQQAILGFEPLAPPQCATQLNSECAIPTASEHSPRVSG